MVTGTSETGICCNSAVSAVRTSAVSLGVSDNIRDELAEGSSIEVLGEAYGSYRQQVGVCQEEPPEQRVGGCWVVIEGAGQHAKGVICGTFGQARQRGIIKFPRAGEDRGDHVLQ